MDLRLEKKFDLFEFGTLGVYVDIWNLLGNSHLNVESSPDGTWLPDDNNTDQGTWYIIGWYKRITGVSGLMRTFQVSIRFSF